MAGKSRRQSNEELDARFEDLELSVIAQCSVLTTHTSSPTIPLNFNNKIFDTHNAVTTSLTNWRFTVPPGKAGMYQVSGRIISNVSAQIYINGVVFGPFMYNTGAYITQAPTFINLAEGDYFDIRNTSSFSITGQVFTDPSVAYIAIIRVGN